MRPPFMPLCLMLALLGAGLSLAGCQQPPYQIDNRYHAANQDSRIQYLVVHYTQIDDAQSLDELTRADSGVSAHYLLSREESQGRVTLYPLVAESQRAWHAGRSHWQGAQALNSASIGLEIVNQGYETTDEQLPLDQRRWQPYTEAQFHAIGALLQTLSNRYRIDPTRIVGHSDISVARKVDPGPRFPWRRLHDEYGVGAWPDEERVTALLATMNTLPSTQEVQQMLIRYGYGLPASGELDTETRNAVAAFQIHFRPGRCDGEIDRETVARLQALLEKYPRG